jgi:hypothetical protein
MRNPEIVLALFVSFLLLFGSVISQSHQGGDTPEPAADTLTQPSPSVQIDQIPPELKKEVKEKYDEYASYAWRWSGAYWGFVFGAAIMSAFAGILLKLDALKDTKLLALSQTDLAALLAGTAALLLSISTAGDFAGKWRANRTAKFRTEQLNNEIFRSRLTADEVVSKLNKIIEDQNSGVINVKDPAK